MLKLSDFLFSLTRTFVVASMMLLQACSTTPEELSLNNVRCLEIQNQAQHFYESSEFQLPEDAQIILSCDDHSGFHWEGEYYIVFETTAQNINAYLETSPWGNQWQNGAVPELIRSRIALSRWQDSSFNSPNLRYLVESSATEEYPGNGRLMVIDSEKNRVFYTEWNY